MYNVSIVIPTYNRDDLLEHTLQTILNQEIREVSFEVIVVDDGSMDKTKEVVEKFKRLLPTLRYYYQPHDGYGAARARNVGITQSDGEIVIFVDTGMLLSKHFIYQHYLSHSQQQACAVIGYVYAFSVLVDDALFFSLLDLKDIDKSISSLKREEKYSDSRSNSYKNFGYEIENTPAPYFYFWTCNVSVRRDVLLRVGGFDENYKSWGMEDVDLGYRLFKNNIRFTLNLQAKAIHHPHDSINDTANKKGSDKKNLIYFHDKYNDIDSEMLLCGREFFYNEALVNLYSNEQNRFNFGTLICRSIVDSSCDSPTLILGGHNGAISTKFKNPVLLEYSGERYTEMKTNFPGIQAYYNLGGKTPFVDKQFELVLITDFWKYLNQAWLVSIVRESIRTGKRTYLLYEIYVNGKPQVCVEENHISLLNRAMSKMNARYHMVQYSIDDTVFEYITVL